MTRRPAGYVPTVGKGQLTHTVHISERPAEADDRAAPGHWEGDLIFGKGMSAVATLLERSSRFLVLVGLPDGHTADVVAAALADKMP
jgi:IS30 family transposase